MGPSDKSSSLALRLRRESLLSSFPLSWLEFGGLGLLSSEGGVKLGRG